MKMTIGAFLFRRLREIGINHIFGVPGDFNLQLLEQLAEVDGIDFVGTCNELNASYAADGYARTAGIGAMLTTYGVGDLSAICGLAGACAEHVPVVLVSGTPPLYAMESRLRVHHSLAEGNFDNINNCLKQFTGNTVRLTPMNVADELDRVLISCWRDKLPVTIQVPSNISYLEVEVPDTPLVLSMPPSDGERLASAVAHITRLLEGAAHPLLLIDADADRCGLAEDLYAIACKRQIPYVAFRTGKGILPEDDPLYLGMYNGKASAPVVAEALRCSDCLLAIAPCFVESSPMAAPGNNPVSAQVYIRDVNVTIEGEVYEGVAARELVGAVNAALASCTTIDHAQGATPQPVVPKSGTPLRQAYFWQRMAVFFRENDLVCVENGTSLTALLENRFPRGTRYIAQPIWGSIGYSLPALLGAMTAEPERRALLFIGDGSFQLTAQELSTILVRGLKPIIFLLNNRGYTIERYILGMNAAYNDVAAWRYHALPQIFAPEQDVYSVEVGTEEELEAALAEAEKGERAAFIELHLDPADAPDAMKQFGAMTAELDYGPRGPQRQS